MSGIHGCTHGWEGPDGDPIECPDCKIVRLARERDEAREAARWLIHRTETFDGENEAITKWPWLEYHA